MPPQNQNPQSQQQTQHNSRPISWKKSLIIGVVLVGGILIAGMFEPNNQKGGTKNGLQSQQPLTQTTPPPTINYPTEKNPTVVRVGVGESAHIIPFEIPDNMDLVIQSWNKENFVYREVDDTVPVVVTPGITISQAKHLRIVIESGIGRPMYVQYYLKPKV
jgi:hypothetical protein